MVHYEPIKVTINASSLAEVIIKAVVRCHGLSYSIVSDWGLIFTSKFWLSLCYYLGIKWRLFTIFHPQIDGQTERQNSTWRPISKLLSILSGMIGPGSYQWLGSPTIMQITLAPVTHLSNWTAVSTSKRSIKKTSIPAPSQNLQTN